MTRKTYCGNLLWQSGLTLLAPVGSVGVHWHQFSDQATTGRFDGEHFQVGWTDVCDRPYRETVDALRSIDLYGMRAK